MSPNYNYSYNLVILLIDICVYSKMSIFRLHSPLPCVHLCYYELSSISNVNAHSCLGHVPSWKSMLNLLCSSVITTPAATRGIRRERRKISGEGFAVVSARGSLERFTERSIKVATYSQREAKLLSKDMVFPQHLLLGLIAEENDLHPCSSHDGFLGSPITLQTAREAVRAFQRHHPRPSDDSNTAAIMSNPSLYLPFSECTKGVLEVATEYSRAMSHHFISPEHISIALFMFDNEGSVADVLNRLGVDINHLMTVAVSKIKKKLPKYDNNNPSMASQGMHEKPFARKSAVIQSSERTGGKSALAQFCVDLTARASKGLVDPVIGRDNEVQRIIQILCRRTKNSPILLGESGVGKTAIAEGLAISIVEGDAPDFLLTKRVMSLDIALLIAGAKERGELEARVTTLIKEILKSGNVILLIDEAHFLIESGAARQGNYVSGLNFANLLKPLIGRGQLQCIACTTIAAYRMYFGKDEAFARRFQPVWIYEPCQADAIRILLGVREKYEAHHNCRFTLAAINAAVHLSARYIPGRHLPDKAIDLIDEAGSRARIKFFKERKEQQKRILLKSPHEYWQEIRTVNAMHDVVLSSKVKHNCGCSEDDASEVVSNFCLPLASEYNEPILVGSADIATVASLWSGIPVQQLTAEERSVLVRLDEQLKKRIVGQEEAVSCVSRAIKRFRVGLNDSCRPMAVVLFCGPTGTGKTELTKALAACYFGSEEAMLRLDMSEYMEQHSVSKLIGSAPGYVGFGEGGTLAEAIRRQPFTLLVLDEVEKAHPDVYNILLQIFEDGHLTNSQGRRVSFKNALVVMTSNIGSDAVAKGRQNPISFLARNDKSSAYNVMKEIVMGELEAYFRPEFLSRIDEVVVFHPLGKAQVLKILDSMLQEVERRLIPLKIFLEVSETVKNLICQKGYDTINGARPLRQAVSLMVEDLLSEVILSGNYTPGDTLFIDMDSTASPFVVVRDQSHRLTDTASFM